MVRWRQAAGSHAEAAGVVCHELAQLSDAVLVGVEGREALQGLDVREGEEEQQRDAEVGPEVGRGGLGVALAPGEGEGEGEG